MTCVWWWLKSMILYCLGRKIRLWRKKKMRNTDRYKTNMTWIIYLPKKKKNSILLVSWTQCIRWFHIVLVLVLHDEREKYPFFFNWWQLNLRKTEKTLIHNNNFTKGGGGGGGVETHDLCVNSALHLHYSQARTSQRRSLYNITTQQTHIQHTPMINKWIRAVLCIGLGWLTVKKAAAMFNA